MDSFLPEVEAQGLMPMVNREFMVEMKIGEEFFATHSLNLHGQTLDTINTFGWASKHMDKDRLMAYSRSDVGGLFSLTTLMAQLAIGLFCVW